MYFHPVKRNMLGPSELILNADGSVYHLCLLPEDIASTIITVGDPDRVHEISKHFDKIDVIKRNREFVTHTGTINGKRLTVLSTGIGTDNIDIVLNELDALVNIDLQKRSLKEHFTPLNFIRLGTSGALQSDIPLGSFLLSSSAFGFDSLLHFYSGLHTSQDEAVNLQRFIGNLPLPYHASCSSELASSFPEGKYLRGHTLTMPGFYAPQGRALRLTNPTAQNFKKFADYTWNKSERLTNLEMETAGIYGLSEILGHHAVSISVLLANRMNGEFHADPKGAMEDLIQTTLSLLASNHIL